MSTLTFRHENESRFKLKGVQHLLKETIFYGDKGLSASFVRKTGDKDFYKIFIKEDESKKGSFEVTETNGDKDKKSTMSEADLKKMVKSTKELAFLEEFLKGDRTQYKGMEIDNKKSKKSKKSKKITVGGASSKKGSKKGSKKASKKGSKKGSKKSSKKASKKSSKKASKKSSKKASKKSSKKASKKCSKCSMMSCKC
jgi:colicin import membrane protein